MIFSRYTIISSAILAFACCQLALSQQAVSLSRENRLVMLTATIKTRGGNHAMGLTKDAFKIVDGKTVRSIHYVEAGDYPASIGILIDTSSSVQFFEPKRLEVIGEALQEVFEAGHHSNEYLLAAFDVDVRLLAEWKTGAALMADKIAIGQNKKNTAMYDACFQAIERFGTAKYERKALIIISDGQDNISRHTFKQLRDLLKRTDVIFYGILAATPADVGSSLGLEGESILSELAEATGGANYFPHNKKQLAQVLNMIATEVRHQYRIALHIDSSEPPNKWHRIKVHVTPPANAPLDFNKLTVRFRQGYYTP